MDFIKSIASQLQLDQSNVSNALQLLDEGATIPFISRYRKERTGGMDEVQLGNLQDAYKTHLDLEKRREFILGSIKEQGVLTEELKRQILSVQSLTALEDLYLPYKPKRKTKAEAARTRGLEPLAAMLMKQDVADLRNLARRFVKGDVEDVDAAYQALETSWRNGSARGRPQEI